LGLQLSFVRNTNESQLKSSDRKTEMTTPRQLVEKTSEILGISMATLIVHDRNLATAPTPLRSVAGRGRAAARVTAVDAANLLIAAVASESVKDSVKTVLAYRDLVADGPIDMGVRMYDELTENHTLGAGLTSLIQAAASQEITSNQKFNLRITFYSPRPEAKIEWTIDETASWTIYSLPNIFPARRELQKVGDLEKTSAITESTILYLGAAVGGLL
jgi:hypothetical protein